MRVTFQGGSGVALCTSRYTPQLSFLREFGPSDRAACARTAGDCTERGERAAFDGSCFSPATSAGVSRISAKIQKTDDSELKTPSKLW